jgi:hypothetical protein
MNSKYVSLAAAGLLLVGLFWFGIGRYVRSSQLHSIVRVAAENVAAIPVTPPDYRQLRIENIFSLPSAEFYEALRAEPTAAREEWWRQIQAMPKGPHRTAALTGFFRLLAQVDSDAAMNLISSIRERELQIPALEAVVKAAPVSVFPKLAEQVIKLPKEVWRPDMQDFLAQIVGEWSEIDPAAVADFMASHQSVNFGAYEMDLLQRWSAIDPEAALRWLNQQERSRWPGGMAIVLPGWYQSNREAALNYIVTHRDDRFVQSGLSAILEQSYENSPEEAQALIERLSDDQSKRIALAGAADIVGRGYQNDAADDPKYSAQAVANWMLQHPPRLWRGHLAKVLDNWSPENHQGLVTWVENQPAQVRNEIAAEYPAPYPPKVQEALTPVLALSDPDLRERLIRAMVTNSTVFSIDQILEKVRDSSLPIDQKDYVVRIMSQARKEQEARSRSKDVGEPLVIQSFRADD